MVNKYIKENKNLMGVIKEMLIRIDIKFLVWLVNINKKVIGRYWLRYYYILLLNK